MRTRKPKKRSPRPMTRERLQRAAIHYLQRFPSSTRHFRVIMERKIQRAHAECPGDEAEYAEWLTTVEQTCLSAGLLNDAVLAKALARSLNRRGSAIRHIRQRLRQKGFDTDAIEESVRSLNETMGQSTLSTDLYAALRYAKRRRFGPFSRQELDWKTKQKQMASLARRGFSYEIARGVIEMTTTDSALDEMD